MQLFARGVVPLAFHRHRLLFVGGHLLRTKLERQLVQLSREAEWDVVVVIEERHRSPCIHPDIEGLVPLEDEWDRVVDVLGIHRLAIDDKRTSPALAEPATVEFEVERKRVSPWLE